MILVLRLIDSIEKSSDFIYILTFQFTSVLINELLEQSFSYIDWTTRITDFLIALDIFVADLPKLDRGFVAQGSRIISFFLLFCFLSKTCERTQETFACRDKIVSCVSYLADNWLPNWARILLGYNFAYFSSFCHQN